MSAPRERLAGIEGPVAFQGALGAYSHMALGELFPEREPVPCASFEAAFARVRDGRCALAVIPIDNTLAGRVADVHHLLPSSGLKIVAEHFLRINHTLLAVPGASMSDVKTVHSHVHALGQVRDFLRRHKLEPKVAGDTAGAAAEVAEWGDPSQAAIASKLAADIYKLDVLEEEVEDAGHNTTRFLVFARDGLEVPLNGDQLITSFLFRVRNVPAALYKALGGFATNGVNMLKLESYIDPGFNQAQFYADVWGHPDDLQLKNALEELRFFSERLETFGTYPASPLREGLGMK